MSALLIFLLILKGGGAIPLGFLIGYFAFRPKRYGPDRFQQQYEEYQAGASERHRAALAADAAARAKG